MKDGSDKPNAAPALLWLMAVSAISFYVVILVSLAEDHLPFDRGRMIGYLVEVAALAICCWAWGWLTRDSAISDDTDEKGRKAL
ncbi:MAG: hypothetical protein WBV94_13860 [Blastocatellia bacterium]